MITKKLVYQQDAIVIEAIILIKEHQTLVVEIAAFDITTGHCVPTNNIDLGDVLDYFEINEMMGSSVWEDPLCCPDEY